MTYNLDCSVCDLKVKDPWRERLAYFADILGAYQPDIACLQELITKKEAVEELGGMAPLANHTRIFYEGSLLALAITQRVGILFYKLRQNKSIP